MEINSGKAKENLCRSWLQMCITLWKY